MNVGQVAANIDFAAPSIASVHAELLYCGYEASDRASKFRNRFLCLASLQVGDRIHDSLKAVQTDMVIICQQSAVDKSQTMELASPNRYSRHYRRKPLMACLH